MDTISRNQEGNVENQAEKVESAGKTAETTVEGARFDEFYWKNFLPLAFGGHCYYVRQDLTGEQWGSHVMQREVGGIALPDTAADRSLFVTVVGIGPNVGTRPSKAHRVEFDWKDKFAKVSEVKVGDRLLIAQVEGTLSNRLKRSPWNWQDECFVEESLPDAIVED